jgi:peptidyl-prolyl cis-trans isomerase D
MLETLRRISKGWAMKIILGLLALTFVVFFGASDFGGGRQGGGLSGRSANSVVEVADVDFSITQVSREYNAQIQQITQASGQQIDPQSPIAASILDQAISTLVNRTLYDVAARDLGVSASDLAVQDAIRRIPAFNGPNGGFDRSLFGGYLRQAGLSEAQFVAGAREDLQRSQYLGTLRAGIAVPEAMLDAVYKSRSEKRIAALATVSTATIEGLSPPDEAQMSAFYEDNKRFFQAPEYRRATIIRLTIEALAANTEIDDEDVAETYAERLDLFQRPERRELLQGIFLDQESAEKAVVAIAGGRPFAEAVEEMAGFPPVAMGTLERSGISEPELAEAAFSADAGAVAGPVESPLGWHLLSVVSVIPEETQPLKDVAEDLRRAISIEQARDDIFDILNAVEDGLAAGSTFEEVASENGLELQRLEDFSARGLMRSGAALAAEPLAEIVNAVFTTPQGEVGDVVETQDGGFFVARVDAITPPQIEPLDRVRDRVTRAWLDSERLKRAIERATEMADRARAGANLEELAQEFGATFETTQPFDRTGLGSTIAGSLITPIFAAQEGDIVEAQTQNGIGVARVVEIRRVSGGGDDLEREDLREQLAEGINRDIAQQLTAALREQYAIDIDRDAIEQSLLPQ